MSYTNAIFYFLTGTGNSFRVACWLRDACQGRGIPARLAPIRASTLRAAEAPAASGLLGIVTPTCCLTGPWP